MKFNDTQFAIDYDTRMSAEGYPGELVNLVHNVFTGCIHVIDIGAGSGHFAIPLAQRGLSVTAIEPSAAMVALFNEKIRDDFRNRIIINQCRWEDWRGQSPRAGEKKATAILCAYSIYGITDLYCSIEKMLRYAHIAVIFIGDDAASTTLSGAIRKALGIPSCARDSREKLVSALDALNINYTRQSITQVRRSAFSDINAESEYFIRHLGLSSQDAARVKQILLELCSTLRQSDSTRHPGTAELHPADIPPIGNNTITQWYFFDNIYCDSMFVLRS